MSVRTEVLELEAMAPLPSEDDADPEMVLKFEKLIRSIAVPVSSDEARILSRLFGTDGCFGLAASLVQRIESAPEWPLLDCLVNSDNPWIGELIMRAKRGGRV